MARKRRGRGEGAVFYSESKACWIGRAIIGSKADGSPDRKEVSARTKSEVLFKIKRAEDQARKGISANAERMTTGEYLEHWLQNISKPSVSPTTWESYERCVRLHLIPRIGGIRLAHLHLIHIEALFAEMQREGMSGGNAKKVGEVLSTALERAVKADLLPKSPSNKASKPKADEKPITPFTPDEILHIRLSAMGHRLEALFALAISTGAREGEILGLGWEHIDLERGMITVARTLGAVRGGFILKEPKSKRGKRQVELPTFAVNALQEHQKRMLVESNHASRVVFCTRTGGFISKSSFIRQVYQPLLKRAEVPYRKFHTFRHTHVSELLARGESVVDVAQRIGDRPDVILKTYAQFIPGAGPKIARRLEEMYG